MERTFRDLKPEEIILGIDPGTQKMGYAILRHHAGAFGVITHGTFALGSTDHTYLKLKKILEFCYGLLDEFAPDVLAIEAPFFGKNVQSMLKLGRAQGVCMAAALSRDIPVFEYSPARIKQSIAGNGAASKEQLSGILKKTLNLGKEEIGLDATDAIGVALCHAFSQSGVHAKIQSSGAETGNRKKGSVKKMVNKSGSTQSWKAFLAENPERKK